MLLSKEFRKPRTERPKNTDGFLTMAEYQFEALRQIKYFCTKHCPWLRTEFLNSEDRVADIMYENMVADWEWNESRGFSKRSYRIQRAFWAIGVLTKRRRKHKAPLYLSTILNSDGRVTSLDQVISKSHSGRKSDSRESFNSIVSFRDNPTRLLQREQELQILQEHLKEMKEDEEDYVRLYYLEGHTLQQIADKYGTRRQNIHQRLSRIKDKLMESINA